MDILSRQLDQISIVSITGSVDALTAAQVTSFLSQQIQKGQNQLVMDLSEVDFMSSAGLRSILSTLKESRQGGGDLRLAAAQPGVEKVLTMSGFTNILKSFPSVEEAMASYTPQQG